MKLEDIYPVCRSFISEEVWKRIVSIHEAAGMQGDLGSAIEAVGEDAAMPGFLPDLARLEHAVAEAWNRKDEAPGPAGGCEVNPALRVLELSWRNLAALHASGGDPEGVGPEPGRELVMVWPDHRTLEVRTAVAGDDSLLALKIVLEGLDTKAVARECGASVSSIDALLSRAVQKGILISPPSALRRDQEFPAGKGIDEEFFSTEVFTLQWHITQACDLRCKHCYDRSARQDVTIEQGYRVLDDLYDFCRSRHVSGQVSFSGGNPFLHPGFPELYRAASERGFALAVLGNPVSRVRIEEILKIEKPVFFQVSLEGLEEHNDRIRGHGHFRRTLEFLGLLRELGIYSMVMLTLTRDNIGQVLPLAGELRGLADLFTFNRLAMFGEGASLRPPSPEEYKAFLLRYEEAAKKNPVISMKDNLLNILRHEQGMELFGGCAGYGCGAAFNFLSLLPDGEVHACRKLPSLIGNAYRQNLPEIYDSAAARRYREGCKACAPCPIRPVCGGCLAVASSLGLNPFEERDPYCFLDH